MFLAGCCTGPPLVVDHYPESLASVTHLKSEEVDALGDSRDFNRIMTKMLNITGQCLSEGVAKVYVAICKVFLRGDR